MSTRPSGIYEFIVRIALTATALLTVSTVSAQSLPPPTLRVTAANSTTDSYVYDVFFSPAATTLLNNTADESPFMSLHSAVYVPNSASPGGFDLIVADTVGGTIVRYFGPIGSPLLPTGTPPQGSTTVWTFTSGGPQQPDGLSVDTAGNLYVVNAGSPQVWVFPATSLTNSPSGFLSPFVLDQTFNPSNNPNGTSPNEVDSLVESIVVPAPQTTTAATNYGNAGITPTGGDLLVLVSDSDYSSGADGASGSWDRAEPALVYDYPAASVQAAITCAVSGTPEGCSTQVNPTILLWELQFPYPQGAIAPYPQAYAVPSGMDMWPVDGSLLISTNLGTILQYPLPSAPVTAKSQPSGWTSYDTFASISGSPCTTAPCAFYKLRTGAQGTGAQATAYAFVTAATGAPTPTATAPAGAVLEFASPLNSTPTPATTFTTATATAPTIPAMGVPEGLALAPATVTAASAATCATGGCNPTGALGSTITGPGAGDVSGTILEQTYFIKDTRKVNAQGSCVGTLTINAASYPNLNLAANESYTVPASICASALTNYQFGLIRSIAPGVDNQTNIVVNETVNPNTLFPNVNFPLCTTTPGQKHPTEGQLQELGYTTRMFSNEGVEPEDNIVNNTDVGNTFIPITGYCDGGGGQTKGNSLFLVGGYLPPAYSSNMVELVAFADARLVYLGELVAATPFLSTATITAAQAQKQLDACLIEGAVLLNVALVDGNFTAAANQIATCDRQVYNNPGNYGSSANYPNAYGDIIGRLQTVYYIINSLIQGNATSTPLVAAP
ncbi:MAG: hypothetical protein ACLQT5_16470 [Steroidobacteraceae bacterium]